MRRIRDKDVKQIVMPDHTASLLTDVKSACWLLLSTGIFSEVVLLISQPKEPLN